MVNEDFIMTVTKNKRKPIEAHNQLRMQEVGSLIREYRRNTMLSRNEFYEEYGFSKSVLERIENGKNVELHSILRLCDIFYLSPSELFYEID